MTLHDVSIAQLFQTSVFFLVLQGHPSAEALGNAGEGQVSLRRSLVVSQSPAIGGPFFGVLNEYGMV